MEKDLDIKLYNEYLDGEKSAFELLYNKYKDKIQYFVYNIVKDYQKAEDITQDVFIYVMQNKIKEGYTFKYYLYLVAKSRAYNLNNMEKRRTEINEDYYNKTEQIGQDVADIVTKNEKRKAIMNAIDMLDDRYKNAIYLVKIEELTYQETAQILGESVQNVKNLIHRGKKELRRILIKKGFDEMNKVTKVIIAILCISVVLAGGVYATMKIIERFTGKAQITPTYTSKLSTMDSNKVWVGTFNLVWNDFMNDVIKGKIEFVDGESELANELNKQSFKAEQLSENSYFKIHGQAVGEDLKNKIKTGIKQKFNEDSKLIERIDWNDSNGYVLYAMLKKEFEFLEPFSTAMGSMEFKNSEILFYNSEKDFAIKLKTKDGEEVILYKTTGENKSFEENYNEIKKQQSNYSGKNTFEKEDILRIPFIKVNDEINYDELCGREIKNSNYYIKQALQTIEFELNNVGGSVKSEAVIDATQKSLVDKKRKMIFDSDFILYLKEENKEQPYFALKVDNTDVLVADETRVEVEEDNEEENKITENTTTSQNNNRNNNTAVRQNNTSNTNNASLNSNSNIDQQTSTETRTETDTTTSSNDIVTFEGTIKNIMNEECVSIVPDKEDPRIASKAVLIKYQKNKGYEIGKRVKVTFKGDVTKSYPQNIDLISIEILN